MKRIAIKLSRAILYSISLVAPVFISAETPRIEATSTTTTSAGTISEFGPLAIVIKTEAGTQPVRYLSSETTNYVDELGNSVSVETVQSGLPVTVFYTKVGDTLVASKVMVRKVADGTAGALIEIAPEKVVIERVPAAQNVTPPRNDDRLRSAENVSGVNRSGLAPGKHLDGFVMFEGRVFAVSDGQAVALTREYAFRVTPSGFIGFDGQIQTLPNGAMFSSAGILMAAPRGLLDANGTVFGMSASNESPDANGGFSNSGSPAGARRPGTARSTGDNSTYGNAQFEFIPVYGNGNANSNLVPSQGNGVPSPSGNQQGGNPKGSQNGIQPSTGTGAGAPSGGGTSTRTGASVGTTGGATTGGAAKRP